MKCDQVAGFLIPRPCPNEAFANCSVCGRPICPEHTNTTSDGAISCASCAANLGEGRDADEEDLRDTYGYNDTAFHSHGTKTPVYSQADYQAFDGGGATVALGDDELVEDLDGS